MLHIRTIVTMIYKISLHNLVNEVDFFRQKCGGKFALGHVDLALAVRQVDVNTIVSCLTVCGRIEDVAHHSAIREWAVSDLTLLSRPVVGQRD